MSVYLIYLFMNVRNMHMHNIIYLFCTVPGTCEGMHTRMHTYCTCMHTFFVHLSHSSVYILIKFYTEGIFLLTKNLLGGVFPKYLVGFNNNPCQRW